jgi:hypothetical protein
VSNASCSDHGVAQRTTARNNDLIESYLRAFKGSETMSSGA